MANNTQNVTLGFSDSGAGGTFNTVTIKKLTPPKIETEEVEVTNSASNGKKQFIAGGLTEIGTMKFDIEYTKNGFSGSLIGYCNSGSMLDWKITFPNAEVWAFPGFVKSFEPTEHDLQKPDYLTAGVEIRPSGSMVRS